MVHTYRTFQKISLVCDLFDMSEGFQHAFVIERTFFIICNLCECGEEALTKIANYEEGSFNNEGVLKALSHIKEIADKGYLLEGTVGMNHT